MLASQQSNQDCEVFGPDRSERKDWNHKYKVFGAESDADWLSFSQIQTQIQNTTARQAPFGKTVQLQKKNTTNKYTNTNTNTNMYTNAAYLEQKDWNLMSKSLLFLADCHASFSLPEFFSKHFTF